MHFQSCNCLDWKGKGKFHRITGHEDREEEQRYSPTLPVTSPLDGVGGQHQTPTNLPPGEDEVPIVREAGWASGPVWTGAESLAPHRDSNH